MFVLSNYSSKGYKMEKISKEVPHKNAELLQSLKKAAFDLNTNPDILENILTELVGQRNKIDRLERRISKLKRSINQN